MTTRDLTVGTDTKAYLVEPDQPNGSAVLFLHWFDEAPNANRSQFLSEAERYAAAGVTCLLPQLSFPWSEPPSELMADRSRIHAETDILLACHSHLAGHESVDESRIALVGHDFGAMHGMCLFGVVPIKAAVLVAPTPRWADWFLRFWPISTDRWDYMRGLNDVDPITTVRSADMPLLFQFGKADFYIAAMTGLELFEAAPEPKELLTYDDGHEMASAAIISDRRDFLGPHLGLR